VEAAKLKGVTCVVNFRPKVRYAWQIPQAVGPECILVGRSNAGKSTLTNTYLQSKGFQPSAPVDDRPGRTRMLTWYPVNFDVPLAWKDGMCITMPPEGKLGDLGKGFCLLDCFGLGEVEFKVKKSRLSSWIELMKQFLGGRRALNTVFHLISCEQEGQLSDGDLQVIDVFKMSKVAREQAGFQALSFVVVLTKEDLVTPEALPDVLRTLREECARRGYKPDEIISCSARDRSGLESVSAAMEASAARGWGTMDTWDIEATKKNVKELFASRRPQLSRGQQRVDRINRKEENSWRGRPTRSPSSTYEKRRISTFAVDHI